MVLGLPLSHSLIRSSDPLVKTSLLICHGLFGSKQNWKSVSRALNRLGCGSVCTVDLRNHGHSPRSSDMSFISMAHDLIRVVNDLNLSDVCLIGHSLGGKASMCASLIAPELFSRLVVLDISPSYASKAQSILPYLRLMSEADFYKAERESDGSLSGVRQWFLDEWKEIIPDELFRSFLLTNLDKRGSVFCWRVNLEAIESCWSQIVAFPNAELQGLTFRCPTLFVAGGRSCYVRQQDIPTIRKYFPNAIVASMLDAGHWVHVDDPHTLLQLLVRFIKGPAEGPPDISGVDYLAT